MIQILFVGLGGCIGSILRFKIGGLILHHTSGWRFPLSTFVVNIVGCALAGVLAALAEKHDFFSPEIRLFLFTGLLGGFTTFSAFGLETVYLIQRQQFSVALFNLLASVLGGIFILWFFLKVVN